MEFEITTANGSRQVTFLVVMSIFLLGSYITVSLRFVALKSIIATLIDDRIYCRHFYLRNVGRDDYFMMAALAAVTGMGIMNGYHVALGTGRHTNELDLTEILIPTLKHWYAFQLVYPFTLYLVKASISSLYLRILTQEKVRKAVWMVAGFITLQTLVVIFVNVRRFYIAVNPLIMLI
jgi:hypothetical protein